MDSLLMHSHKYSPIETFEIYQDAIPSGRVRGYAAPASGIKPSALVLIAGEDTIATAAAINFSSDAKKCDVRLGWCGFEIGGFGQALPFGENIELRCAVSGKTLARWNGLTLAAGLIPQSRNYLTVDDMLSRLQKFGSCDDIDQVIHFALEVSRRNGAKVFLEMTFQYLLGVTPNRVEINKFVDNYTTIENVRECWNIILKRKIYNSDNGYLFPGPFNSSFPFPLDIFNK